MPIIYQAKDEHICPSIGGKRWCQQKFDKLHFDIFVRRGTRGRNEFTRRTKRRWGESHSLIDVDGRMCSAERVWLHADTVERGCVEWFRFAAIEIVCVARATAPMRCSYNSNALVKYTAYTPNWRVLLLLGMAEYCEEKIERPQFFMKILNGAYFLHAFSSCQKGTQNADNPAVIYDCALFPENYFRLVFDALLNPLENVGIWCDRTKPQAGYNLRDQYGNSSTEPSAQPV